MEQYKQDFIEFMVRSDVLTFGDFVTKSGRKTPFFINTGNYRTGTQIMKLGEFYRTAIKAALSITTFSCPGVTPFILYGPAYKGIPLAVATSIAFAREGIDIPYCFNRKEAKDHGEGGKLIGANPDRSSTVLIIEDVVTAGTSARESMYLLTTVCGVTQFLGLMVSVDRMEKGAGVDKSALAQLKIDYGLASFAIVNLDEIVEYLFGREIDGRILIDAEIKKMIDNYRAQWGAER
ncbi:MAG TPA: orotate phosphoribosyltransferase [Candidatus Methylomirabilis sp.]|nr:orotate phosphoribosyltransferase [Candidatus Methylomirabilis sp.]